MAGIESGMKSVRLAEPPAAPALAPWAIPFPKPVCQLCEKPGHTAQTCYSFRDPETVKWFVDANAAQPGRGGRGRGRGGRHSGRGVGADQGATDGSIADGGVFPEEPGISSVASQSNGWMGQTQPWDYSAHSVTDLTSVCATALPDGEEGLCDFEHDDHADVHILRNAVAAGFFKSTEDGECTLAGFSSNMSVVASARGSLVLDLGIAVCVKTATKNLLSGIQLRKAYEIEGYTGTEIVYVHKVDRSTLVFRLEPDGYFHTKLKVPDGWSVSSVDLPNPPPLIPFLTSTVGDVSARGAVAEALAMPGGSDDGASALKASDDGGNGHAPEGGVFSRDPGTGIAQRLGHGSLAIGSKEALVRVLAKYDVRVLKSKERFEPPVYYFQAGSGSTAALSKRSFTIMLRWSY